MMLIKKVKEPVVRIDVCVFTWIVRVYNSEDGLQRGAMAIQSLKQTLVNVLQEEKCQNPLMESINDTVHVTICLHSPNDLHKCF